MSIHEVSGKIKGFLVSGLAKDILLALIIVFFSLASFMLGEASGKEKAAKNSPLIVDGGGKPLLSADLANGSAEAISALGSTSGATGTVAGATTQKILPDSIVASKKGTKYYLGRCSGAKALSPANLVFFPNEASAQAAGYTKSTSCK